MSWQPPFPDILMIANGEAPSPTLFAAHCNDKKTLVAVDGGLKACAQLGIVPHLIVGDFDSASTELRSSYTTAFQKHTPDQTKSDLEKALEFLFSFPVQSATVLGALGKRLDHTLANTCLLCRYPRKVLFATEEELCFALETKSELSCRIGQRLSLIPLGAVKGISTQGLKWELANATLNSHFVGLSNVCLNTHVSIHFQSGDLIVCLESGINTL